MEAESGEAKVAWLQRVANEAFASLDRGEGLAFDSVDKLDDHIIETSKEVWFKSHMS